MTGVSEQHLRRRVGRNVRTLRHAAKLTIVEAAHRGTMSPRHWGTIEAGQLSANLGTLCNIAHALGDVDPSVLLAP